MCIRDRPSCTSLRPQPRTPLSVPLVEHVVCQPVPSIEQRAWQCCTSIRAVLIDADELPMTHAGVLARGASRMMW
eukprot:15473613-Alexandrium_andersonii.AAC.1